MKYSGRKGKQGERQLAKILTERFGQPFSRSVGSGNRWSQANLTATAQNVYTGDVVTPDGFRFCIESKRGYPEVDLHNALDGGSKGLDAFLEQAQKDAERVNKKPLLCWKRDRQPWLAFVKVKDFTRAADYRFSYRDWVGVALSVLLAESDEFFFCQPMKNPAEAGLSTE